VRLPDGWWPPAAIVAGGWLVAALVASWAGEAADASSWQLVLNQVVLLPAAVVAVYDIGRRLGGLWLGVWFGVVLLFLPFAGWAYAFPVYRDTFRDRVLVEAVGGAAGGRFAAGALSVVAAALVLRALGERGRVLPLAAGTAAGAAIVVEPAACLVVVGAVLGCLVARRLDVLAVVAAPVVVGGAIAILFRDAGVGLDVSWDAFSANMAGLREYTWSNRLLQWLPIAGTIGLARRSWPAAALVGGWFGAFVLAEAASADRPVKSGAFFLAFLPALPALAVLVAAVPLLVPGLPARLAAATARA
jgi:hypothetical protein